MGDDGADGASAAADEVLSRCKVRDRSYFYVSIRRNDEWEVEVAVTVAPGLAKRFERARSPVGVLFLWQSWTGSGRDGCAAFVSTQSYREGERGRGQKSSARAGRRARLLGYPPGQFFRLSVPYPLVLRVHVSCARAHVSTFVGSFVCSLARPFARSLARSFVSS